MWAVVNIYASIYASLSRFNRRGMYVSWRYSCNLSRFSYMRRSRSISVNYTGVSPNSPFALFAFLFDPSSMANSSLLASVVASAGASLLCAVRCSAPSRFSDPPVSCKMSGDSFYSRVRGKPTRAPNRVGCLCRMASCKPPRMSRLPWSKNECYFYMTSSLLADGFIRIPLASYTCVASFHRRSSSLSATCGDYGGDLRCAIVLGKYFYTSRRDSTSLISSDLGTCTRISIFMFASFFWFCLRKL